MLEKFFHEVERHRQLKSAVCAVLLSIVHEMEMLFLVK